MSGFNHHMTNASAVAVPGVSLLLDAPKLAAFTAILGAIWYLMIIGEKLWVWKHRRDARLLHQKEHHAALQKKKST